MDDKRKWLKQRALARLKFLRLVKAHSKNIKNSVPRPMVRLAPNYVDYSLADSNSEPQPAHTPGRNQAPANMPRDPPPRSSARTAGTAGSSIATRPPRSAHPDPDAIPSSTSFTPPGTPPFVQYTRRLPVASFYLNEVIEVKDSDEEEEFEPRGPARSRGRNIPFNRGYLYRGQGERENRGSRGRNTPDNGEDFYPGQGPSRGFAHEYRG